MPCQINGCANAVDPITNSWNVGNLCNIHYNTIAANYSLVTPEALKSDFIKVHLLLHHNARLCLDQMQAFNNEMTTAQTAADSTDQRFHSSSSTGKTNYLKLSRALEYYEGICWFPANRALLSGLLSTPDFNKSLKLGFNKDTGAGIWHGEQSHRLQWHAIMRLMTVSFTKPFDTTAEWSHSPLQLFYHYTQGNGTAHKAWGKAMDAQSNTGWGNPDNVVIDILQSGYVFLVEALKRRLQKYGGVDPINPITTTHGSEPARVTALNNAFFTLWDKGLNKDFENQDPTALLEKLKLQIYTWEKTGFPFFPSGNFNKAAKKLYEEAKKGVNAQYFHTDNTYKKQGENLLVKKDAPSHLVEIDTSLVSKSRVVLNTTQYTFGLTGAKPIHTNYA
jgi:hypothetical protein